MYNCSEYRRLGFELLQASESLGARFLDCFGEDLSGKLYFTFGYKVYKEIENVKMRNGELETLYFMKLERQRRPHN
jgi:hypothetical protein